MQVFKGSKQHNRRDGTIGPPLIPIVLTLSHHLSCFNSRIKMSFSQAQENCQPLRQFKLITGYRRNCNLKDTLVHTALDHNKIDSDPWLLHYLPFIFNEASGRGFPICLIYVIRCEHCRKLYIGKTRRTLKTRIAEHLNNIKRHQHYHFVKFGLQNFKYIGIESNPLWSTKLQWKCESSIIRHLLTFAPQGLNEKT